MGIYLNPGNENFKETTLAEVYVDKTMMIHVINGFMDRGNKYICISRPRRFGKTIAGNMLNAYYSKGCDSEELFRSLKIATAPDFHDKLNRYNVIKLDLNSEYQNTRDKEGLIDSITEDVKEEMKKAFPTIDFEANDTLARCILKVYAKTGETFILIIDEYDVLVREQVSESLFQRYLSFLNGLFKSDTLRPAISLAYLTGILPVVRDKIQSKLNNFREYTILDAENLAEFVGFTEDEVKDLCRTHNMDFAECQRWYDGYHQYGYDIYNPESVVVAMRKKRYGSYWSKTSTYEVVAERIRQNFSGTREAVVKMLSGEKIPVNVLRFMNTMDSFSTKDDLFTYLIHVGYLAYDFRDETCRIPNREIQQEWLAAIETEPEYEMTNRIIAESRDLLEETIYGNEEAIAEALDRSHIHVTSNRSYNNEDALQSAIYLAYIYALNEYTCIREATAGRGFADVIYIPIRPSEKRPAMIIELKRNKTAESALDQIREKKYFKVLQHYEGNLLFVGINYDETEKTHTCRIERFHKDRLRL